MVAIMTTMAIMTTITDIILIITDTMEEATFPFYILRLRTINPIIHTTIRILTHLTHPTFINFDFFVLERLTANKPLATNGV
jgi:hypothetical protein